MVEVVSGPGTGLSTSSRSTLGSGATSGDPQLGRGNESVFVNTTNGNLIVQSLDENLSALGLDVALVRTYNSQGTIDDDNGDNWRIGANQRLYAPVGPLNQQGSTVKKIFGDGAEATYTYDSALAAYVSTDGNLAHDTLVWNGTTWTWTNGSTRVRETYNWNTNYGRIQTSVDPNGNTVNYFYSSTTGLLNRIQMAGTSAIAQDVYLDYYTGVNETSNVSQVRVVSGSSTQVLTRYYYNASGQLATVWTDITPGDGAVSDNDVYVTNYTYDSATLRLASITQTRGTSTNVISKMSFTYVDVGGTKRIRTVTDGEGRVATYNYSNVINTGGNSSQPLTPGWSVPELIDSPDPTMSAVGISKIAFDGDGNGFAIWNNDWSGGAYAEGRNVIARRYDRATNTWGPPVVLDTGTSAGQVARVNSLSVDDLGNALVAWSQTDGAGTYSVYASRYTSGTGTWNGPTLLENLSGQVDFNPMTSLSTAIASASSAAVSWIQSDGTANSTYVARWNGSSWVVATTPVESGASATKQTALAADGAGNVTVVWIQANANGVDNVMFNRFDVATGTWSGAQTLQLTAGGASRAQIAFDFAGNGIAAWVQDGNILARRYDKATNTWAATVTIVDSRADAADSPSIALDRQTGAGFIAWAQSDGTSASVYVRNFSALGNGWQAERQLDNTTEAVVTAWQQGTTALAASMRGTQGVVMWCQNQTLGGVNRAFDVMVARFNGTTWSAAEALQYDAGTGGGFFNAVAVDAQGNVSAIWAQYNNPGTYFSRYTAPGSWTGAMSLTETFANAHFVKSAADANGNIFAIYLGADTRGVIARRYDKATNTWGTPYWLDTNLTPNNYCQTALSVDEYGNALAVWNRNTGSGNALYATRFDVLQNTWGPQFLIQTGAQPIDVLRPGGFAVQISGMNAVIAWLQKNGSTYEIGTARFAGTLPQPALRFLEAGIGNATYVSATVDKAGNMAIASQRLDTALGIDRIYVNRFNPGTGQWSVAAPLSGTTAAATAPQIGFDAFGNGIAIWSQGNDVYQSRSILGGSWSAPTTIDNVNGVAESTTLSVDRLGNAIAAWIQTDAGGVKSLYAARFTYAGGGSWSPAVLLETSSQVVRTNPGTAAFVVATAIHGDNAAVSWLQKTPAGDQANLVLTEAWVNRWNGSAWSGAEMVSNAPGLGAFDPSVSIDNQGNTAVFYSHYADKSQIWVNRYNVNTPRSAAVAYAPPTRFANYAQTAYDSAGNGFAAWTGAVGSTTYQYVSRYDKARGTWSAPFAIDSTTTGPGWWMPSISVDEGGNAVLAWSRSENGTYNLYASRYSVRTGTWSTPTAIDTSTEAVLAGTSNRPADLGTAIASENAAAVVWLQGASNDVYVARWNGTAWTTSSVETSGNSASNVSVTMDLDGNVSAAWLQADATAASVFHSRYTATGATPGWSTAAQIDLVSTATSRPLLGADAFGNVIAAWTQGSDLVWRRYDRAAGSWGSVSTVNTGMSTPAFAALAVDALGNAVLGWIRADGVANSVYASILKAGASTWSAATLLENSNLTASTAFSYGVNVAVAIRAGLAAVNWNQRAPWGATETAANVYEARWTGSSWTPATQIDQTSEATGNYFARVGIDAQGNTISHFTGWNGVDTANFVSRYTADSAYTQTTVSDGLGKVTVYKHDSLGRLISVTAPAVNGVRSETRYQYDREGNVNAVIEDAGGVHRTTTMIYDTRGNLVLAYGADGSVTRRTYDANNQLTIEALYMAPDVVSGPAQPPLVTRYYYDSASNLRFVVSPDGRVTEHRYYSSGSIGERQYTFVYTATSYANAAYDMADLTTWVSQAANRANLERTEYTYDPRGNLLTQTRWATTDATGAGTGTASITSFTYDQRGLLTQKIEPRGTATSGTLDYVTNYAYDGMRRVTLENEWISGTNTRVVRTVIYDDANNKVITTLANGIVSTSVFDRSGRLISEGKSNGPTTFGTTEFRYDYAGRLIMTSTPTGDAGGSGASAQSARTFVVYDEMGRKAGDVDGDGTLTQYVYNQTNQVIKAIRYSSLLPDSVLTSLYNYASGTIPNPMSIKALTDSLATVAGRNAENDQITYNAYDNAGRLAATVKVLLTYQTTQYVVGITRFYYTGKRLTDSVEYTWRPLMPAGVTSYSLAQIDAVMTGNTDATKDRRTRNFYDGDGNLIAVLDAAGYLTESQYDAGGRITRVVRYANVTPAANPAVADLAALRPVVDTENQESATPDDEEQDIVTRFYHDGQGRKIGELDGEGYLTETQYDVDGHVTQTARYDYKFDPVAISGTTTFATLKQSVAGLTGLGVAAKVTKFEYDGAGRLTKTTELTGTSWSDSEGLAGINGNVWPFLAFDSAGNGLMLTTTNGLGPNSERTDVMARRYDAATKTWGPAVMLDMGSGFIWNVSVSMDDAGNAVAAWSQADAGGTYSVYAARFTPTGGWSPTVAIETSSTQVDYYNQGRLATAIASASAAAVSWVQYEGATLAAYAARWDGTSWSTARIDNKPVATLKTSEVSVAIDTSGRTTVVWLETTSGSPYHDILYARYSNGSWSTPATLDSATTSRSYMQVAFDQAGNGFATWVQGAQILGRRFTVAAGWGSIVTLSDATNTNQPERPTLAVSSSGEAVVAWAQGVGSGTAPLSLNVVRWNGSTWSAPTLLENSAEPLFTAWQQGIRPISIAMRGTQAAIAWTQHQPVGAAFATNSDIMVSRWNGTGWDRAEAVEQMANAWGGFFVSVGIDAQGNTFAAYHNSDGTKQTRVVHTDPGLVTTLGLDNMDHVTSTVRAAGTTEARTTQARYDALGRKTQELSAEGAARIAAGMDVETAWNDFGTRYAYDNAGRLISATQHVNGTVAGALLKARYYYDADGRLRFVIDPRGQVQETQYDALGNVSAQASYYVALDPATLSGLTGGLLPAGLETTLRQTANTLLDAKTTYSYDTSGRVVTSTTAADTSTYFHYNAFGNVDVKFEYLDATNYVRHEYEYDRRGSLTRTVWDRLGVNAIEDRSYDAFGRLKQVTDARLNITKFEYDRLGRQIATVDPFGARPRTFYDAFSRKTKVRDALGNETTYTYNDATRRVIVTTPEGISIATEQNRHGEVLRITNATKTTTYTYDANGQLKTSSDGLGSLESRSYDSIGRQVSATDARGTVTSFGYDASNRLVSRTADVGGLALVTGYGFGSDSTSVYVDTTEPGGRVTRTRYDQDGRTVSVTQGYGSGAATETTTKYSYDRASHVLLVTEGEGSALQRKTKYTYDTLGRRIEEILDPDGLALRTAYKYDKNGNVTRKIEGAQLAAADQRSTWYVYDANNRLTHTIDALGGVTENTYDLEGHVVAVRRYATAVSTSGFADVVTSVAPSANAALDRIERTVYDRDGRGAYTIDALGGVTERTFDRNGNVTRVRLYAAAVSVAGNPTLAQVQSALTAAGNDLVTVGTSDRVRWTVYDERDRAIYDVDANGAVTRTIYNLAGDIIETEQFATTFTGADKSRAAIDAWVATTVSGQSYTVDNDPSNRVRKFWYDGLGRARYSLDAEGYLTETVYDDAQRKTTDKAYYSGPYSIASSTATSAIAGLITANPAEDRYTITERDQVGRVVKVTDSYGNYEQYTYNALGGKETYRNKLGAIWDYDYDVLGRLTDEYTPSVDYYDVTDQGETLSAGTAINARIRTHIDYDTFSNVWKRTEAYGTSQARITEFRYDKLNRQVRTYYPSVRYYDAAADSVYRVGSAVVRSDSVNPATIFSTVTYNTLGDAVVDMGMAGNRTYRVYDQLGRMRYEVDAEAYVSRHDYDRFGNETVLTRYANKYTGTLDGTPLSLDTFSAPAASSDDRTITKGYTKTNLLFSEQLSSVYWYSIDGNGTGYVNFSPITYYSRNTFGEVYCKAALTYLDTAGNGIYANTYYFMDRLGRVTAEVDPLKYLTATEYDAVGNVKRRVEYATALASQNDYATPIVRNALNAPGNAAGYDRETKYGYDRLNRLKTETSVNVEFSTISGSGVGQQVTRGGAGRVKDVVTTYDYDAVGNRTTTTSSETGATVYSYYDALGRTRAVADVTRSAGGGTTITPLVEFRRDARGDVVQQIQYANSATGVSAAGYSVTANANDQKTTSLLDAMGRALRVEDPSGADRFMSYTLKGEVAKEWQRVTHPGDASVNDAIVTIRQYDQLGREIVTLQPQTLNAGGADTTPTVVAKTVTQYNAFGDVVARGVYENSATAVAQEFFHYDNAGRLWRTNSGDGVTKVYLYDLAGRQTAEFRARNTDLAASSITNAQQAVSAAAAGGANPMRVERRFDFNGGLIEQRLPSYYTTDLTEALDTTLSIGTMNKANEAEAGYKLSVSFGQGGQTTTTLDWSPTSTSAQGGGFRRDRTRNASYSYTAARYIYWSDPPNIVGEVSQILEYRVANSGSGWTPVTVDKLFASDNKRYLGVAASVFGSGTYEIRVKYLREGDTAPFAIRTGTVTNPSSASSAISDTTASNLGAQTYVSPATTQTVDRWGNVLAARDALLNTTNYRYDLHDQLIETLLPSVTIVSVASATGAISTTTGRPKQENHYDALGRLIATKNGNDVVNVLSVNEASQVISETHGDGGGVSYQYDAFGNRVGMTDELLFKTRYTYNKQNLQTMVEQEAVVSAIANGDVANIVVRSFGYDEAGRRVTDTDGLNHVTKTWYDLRGNVRKRATPRGYATTLVADLFGNTILETNALDEWKSWTYSYFGRVLNFREIGETTALQVQWPNPIASITYNPGILHTYSYDSGGLLTSVTSTAGQSNAYTYDGAGHLTRISETGSSVVAGLASTMRQTDFIYDAMGRHVRERTVVDGLTHQALTISYDAAGRLAGTWDLNAGLSYSYDAAGNRTRIKGVSTSQVNSYIDFNRDPLSGSITAYTYTSLGWYVSTTSRDTATTDYWYRYDLMGRLLTSRGANVSGSVVGGSMTGGIDSIAFTYDLAGNRKTQTAYGTKYTWNGSQYSQTQDFSLETYYYDGAKRLTYVYKDAVATPTGQFLYDAASRQWYAVTRSPSTSAPGGLASQIQTVSFDDDNRPTTQTTTTNASGTTRTASIVNYGTGGATSTSTLVWDQSGGAPGEPIEYSNPHFVWSNGFDAAGNLRGYTVRNHDTSNGNFLYEMTYQTSYQGGETYLEKSQFAFKSAGTGTVQPNTTRKTYNLGGELVTATDDNKPVWNRTFANGADGKILTSIQGYNAVGVVAAFTEALNASNSTNTIFWQRYFFANGDNLGSLGFNGYIGGGPQGPVQRQALRLNVDDGSIQPAEVQAPSQVVTLLGETLRDVARRIWGDASLWYLLAEENGYPDPTTALAAGTTLIVPNQVVSVGNSAGVFQPFDFGRAVGDTSPYVHWTQPPPPKPKCGGLGAIIVLVIAIIITVWLDKSGTVLKTALANIGITSTVAQTAIFAAIGSTVAQGVGIAIGVQDRFDWKQVALSAISAGVGKALDAAKFLSVATHVSDKIAPFLQGVINGAIGSALTQGVSVIVGVQKSFSWREVAMAGLAGGASSAVGAFAANRMGLEAGSFGNNLVSGLAGAAVRASMGGKVDVLSVYADAFGHAIGDALVGEVDGAPAAGRTGAATDESTGAAAPAEDDLSEVVVTARRTDSSSMDNNPGRSGQEDLEEIVVTGRREQSSSFTVGAEGARGYWGVAQGQLGEGASNSDIHRQMLLLMSANPGRRVLHRGDVLNAAGDTVTDAAMATAAEMDAEYQARRRSADPAADITNGSSDAFGSNEFRIVLPRITLADLDRENELEDLQNLIDAHPGAAAYYAVDSATDPNVYKFASSIQPTLGDGYQVLTYGYYDRPGGSMLPNGDALIGHVGSGLYREKVSWPDPLAQEAANMALQDVAINLAFAIGGEILMGEGLFLRGASMAGGAEGSFFGRGARLYTPRPFGSFPEFEGASLSLGGRVDALGALQSRTGMLSGVPEFDQLFSGTPQAGKMLDALARRGVNVIDDASRLRPGVAAEVFSENGQLTLVYDSKGTSFLDMLHETRHVAQVQRVEAANVLGNKTLWGNDRLLGAAERGAYEYEMRLGAAKGFSPEYMNHLQGRIRWYYPSSYSAKFNASPTYGKIFNVMEPRLKP